MRVIARSTLREFWCKHADAETALCAWYHEASAANWANGAQVKERYPSASIITAERVVFNICGNKYRLVVHINYSYRIVYIRFIGTHSEYDKVNAEKI